jgi:hypothetical protein
MLNRLSTLLSVPWNNLTKIIIRIRDQDKAYFFGWKHRDSSSIISSNFFSYNNFYSSFSISFTSTFSAVSNFLEVFSLVKSFFISFKGYSKLLKGVPEIKIKLDYK